MPPSRDPLKDLVQQYRTAIDPLPEHVEHERARLLARLAADPLAGASRRPRSRRLALAVALAAAFVLVLVGLHVYIDLRVQQALDASQAVQQAPPLPVQPIRPNVAPRVALEPSPDPPSPADPAPLAPAAPPVDAPLSPESPAVAPTAPRRGLAQADDADALLRESALLSRAREAQARGEWQRVLELVDQHARSHPRGLLLEERLVLEAGAACNADQLERGRKALQALARRFPRSLALARVRDICERPADE